MATRAYDENGQAATSDIENGVTDEDRASATRMRLAMPQNAHDAAIIRKMDREKQMGEIEVTLTLKQLCDAVGWEVSPSTFASDALSRIADQIDAQADSCVNEAGHWNPLVSIATRARFAAGVARTIEGGDYDDEERAGRDEEDEEGEA